jgi:hypothetical protein
VDAAVRCNTLIVQDVLTVSIRQSVGYSTDMNTTEQAPEIHPGYPYKRRVFPAWQQMWDILRDAAPTSTVQGRSLAEFVAAKHGLSVQTLTHVLARAATAGLLDVTFVETAIDVTRTDKPTGRTSTFPSKRVYAHYRIRP